MGFSETLKELQELLFATVNDLKKVQKGNKTAAQRVRVATLKITKVGKLFRKESVFVEKTGVLKTHKNTPVHRKVGKH